MRVPATTSNLGPGFDCLGVALQIYNFVTVARDEPARSGRNGATSRPQIFSRGRLRSLSHFPAWSRARCHARADSAAVSRCGSACSTRSMPCSTARSSAPRSSSFVPSLEGHPDNAAPAEFGGFVVARHNRHQKFPIEPHLHFVLLIPAFEIKTAEARGVLPNKINRLRAVESCGNACLITAALASGNYENLRGVFVRSFSPTFPSEIRSLSRSSDRCRGRCRRARRFPERLRFDHCLPDSSFAGEGRQGHAPSFRFTRRRNTRRDCG